MAETLPPRQNNQEGQQENPAGQLGTEMKSQKTPWIMRRPFSSVGRLVAKGLREAGYEISLKPLPPEDDTEGLRKRLPESAQSNLYQLEGSPESIKAFSRIYSHIRAAYEKTPKKSLVAAVTSGVLLKVYLDHAKKGQLPPRMTGKDVE